MSHRLGTVNPLPVPVNIGPDSGAPTSPNTWLLNFVPMPSPAPMGTRFVILHFTGASFPAANRLEVDLGYDMDVFTSADGADFWTRPVKPGPGGTVTIRYITAGANAGHVTLTEFGRGEQVESGTTANPAYHNLSNPDVFLLDSPYVEPFNETRGICGVTVPPNWENVACYPIGSVQETAAKSVCIFIHVEINETTHLADVSSCTGTLIAPDMVLCAGHCVSDPNNLNIVSGSVSFDFATNCDGSRPAGYNAHFYKVHKAIRVSRTNPQGAGGLDYSLLQLKLPIAGIANVPMRPDLPAVNDPVFLLHHPQGIAKKVSPKHLSSPSLISSISSSFGYRYLYANTDLTGGSSGSALFDLSGRIIGVADISGNCQNGFLSITEVLKDLASAPPLAARRDVMMVFDRSGSMSLDAGTGRTKIVEARDAASLFVQLIRAGAGDKIGLVSFSTTASSPADFGLTPANAGSKNALVGPSPFTGGIVSGIAPGGYTSIGGGLQAAANQFPAPGPGVNLRTILLMTDGLQNTPPMIADVSGSLNGTDLSVIGFGNESSLDGVLLDQLAQDHGGLYTRAGSPLQLKKFFVLAFGNIFESGTLSDPEYFMPAAERSKIIPFSICSDDSITVVVGWDRSDTNLLVQLNAPNGTIITSGAAGTDSSSGNTWTFLRVPLPFGGARDGAWTAEMFRPGGGEFPPPGVDLRFFVNIVVDGGPKFVRLDNQRKYYSGDMVIPIVMLRNTDGTTPRGADVKLTVTRPVNGAGNILTASKLGLSQTVDGDVIPARQSTLLGLESVTGKPAITYVDQVYDLFDDGLHKDGALEPDGIFGNPINDLFKIEGSYTFHAVATYGDGCTATRELIWTTHVDVSIDPSHSVITTQFTGVRSDGQQTGVIVITPKDVYGNNLGPGRGDAVDVNAIPGTTITGTVKDNGDGTYMIPIAWDPDSGQEPGITVSQPGRPPVLIQPVSTKPHHHHKWKWISLFLLILLLLLLLIWLII